MPKSKKTKIQDLPLSHSYDLIEGDGYIGVRATLQRGLLAYNFVHRVADDGRVLKAPSAHARFEAWIKLLRTELKQGGYPTDLEYVWIKVDGGEWRYDDDVEDDLGGQRYKLRRWHDQLTAMTEPLSRDRLIGDLLDAIDQLLRRNSGTEMLELCWTLMDAYLSVAVALEFNPIAALGVKTRASLAEGPKVRHRLNVSALDIIYRHTEAAWRKKPSLRGSRSNTASEIEADLNKELVSLGYKTIKAKTIAEKIAKGISEKILQIG